jgi:hypothetical protein
MSKLIKMDQEFIYTIFSTNSQNIFSLRTKITQNL